MKTVEEVTARMAEAKAVVAGKRLRFDFGEEGSIYLDGVAEEVSNGDGDADTTVRVSFSDFLAMADGSLNSTMAFMQGKVKIEGDMSVAMQLQSVTAKLKG